MAWALHACIVDPGDGEIKVEHIFYGETEEECDDYYQEHLGTCSYFRGAEHGDKVISWYERIGALPTEESCEEEAERHD
jgi:hypothetical protein